MNDLKKIIRLSETNNNKCKVALSDKSHADFDGILKIKKEISASIIYISKSI